MIARTVDQALVHARNANAAAHQAVAFFALKEQPDTNTASKIRAVLNRVPPLPDGAYPALLATMFDAESDPKGQRSLRLLSETATEVNKIRRLFESASRFLSDGQRLPLEAMEDARKLAEKRKLSSVLLAANIDDALKTASQLEKSLKIFEVAARTAVAPYGPTGQAALDTFLVNCGKVSVSGLALFPIRSLATRAAAVLETAKSLSEALFRFMEKCFCRADS
jgi:hypothetical protein